MSKRIENRAAQGDVLILRVAQIPYTVTPVRREPDGALIVTHSETGHHHVIERPSVDLYQDDTDPLTAWLEVHDVDDLPQVAELVHRRSYHTHETLEIPPGRYKIRRQRQYTPTGWDRVVD